MNIGIVYNKKTNPKNKEFAFKIAQTLEKYGIRYEVNPKNIQSRNMDMIIAAGGDGTVLHVADEYARQGIPILGINFGHRGYLCAANASELESAIEKISNKQYHIAEKTRIQAKILKSNGSVQVLEALNEISIGGINRTVHLFIKIKTEQTTLDSEIIGDGVIIATTTGSTAYNINAGGPMLITEAFSVVANNAFFQSNCLLPITKSIVTSSDAVISINDLSGKAANLPFAISDGQQAVRLGKEDKVIIKKSEHKNLFVLF